MFPNRRSTLKAPDPNARGSLTRHVADAMGSAHRATYYQRIVFVGKLVENKLPDEVVIELRKFIATANANKDDKITGLLLVDTHIVGMIEGPEDCLTRFLQILNKNEGIVGVTKIVLVYNNANRRFYDKVLYKTDPFSTTALARSILTTEPSKLVQMFVKRLYDRCSSLAANIDGEIEPSQMPSSAMCDLIISIDILQTLSEYLSYFIINELPKNYSDAVWPTPGNSVPYYAADLGPYDVNIIFEKEMSEMAEIITKNRNELKLKFDDTIDVDEDETD